MGEDFNAVDNTIVVSDIHLADAEPPHPTKPLWKSFKRPEHFIDRSFKTFLEYVRERAPAPIELVLNGDIFDFDSVMVIPEMPRFHVSWLERLRGMSAEEPKSRFKLSVILNDHPVWVEAIREFILGDFVKGGLPNRLVFVTGNHDIEFHWPSVRQDFVDRLALPEELKGQVRFCEFFYISNRDTLIEHGNQYDAYCLSSNPINPLIHKGSKVFVRVPFGNVAGRFMSNGMGLLNPHADTSFIKSSAWDYMVFYFKHVVRAQPFMLWTWFWSALVTLVYSISEGLLPAMTDPLTVRTRVEDIARRANSTPDVVWALKDLHAHPAIYNPIKIMRELWLDRAILFGFIVFLSFQIFSFSHLLVGAGIWWFIIPMLFLTPAFILYSRSVVSELEKTQKAAIESTPVSAGIAGVKRVVQGHLHRERHTHVGNVEYLNTGTWSPAFKDVACTQPYGRKCFAWIKPGPAGERIAELYEWSSSGPIRIEHEIPAS